MPAKIPARAIPRQALLDQKNPEGVDQQPGPAGKAIAEECNDIRPPGTLAVDDASHQRAEQGHEEPMGGDDQPDGRGCNTQTIPHQVQHRGNDASGHDGQGGGSEDNT